NVCNHVPTGAISLAEILEPRNCTQRFWSVEVIHALDRAIELIEDGDYVCFEAERILWSRIINNPLTGEKFIIEGLNSKGALKLRQGAHKIIWNRWPL
ncbi:MAG: biotin--[acetyl-CoA-carboxylase] ligase, partial [Prochlorococcaceae cyanobacterium ETNP1_MAG_9]|nr:biotin--[acetyl-CoA-carboxylase] ligase [Prochlorococcaceae cyanobacterium ETNP1_MAG_9]